MTIKIKKTYGSNFDFLTADKDGQEKTFIKTVKKSDEIGTFDDQEGWSNFNEVFDGIADCEFEVTIDTDIGIVDSLGNIYFALVE